MPRPHRFVLGPLAALVLAALPLRAARAQGVEDVTPPVVESHVDAVYPADAVPAGTHADVVLAVTVDVHGHVSKVDVLESGGHALDEAAILAARQWTFLPAKRKGVAIAARIRVPFHFAPPAPPPEAAKPEPVVPGNVVPSGSGTGATAPSPSTVGGTAAPPEAQKPPPEEEHPPHTTTPEVVNVRGRTPAPSRGASDFDIRIENLNAVPRKNASDLLKLAPGILLTNAGGEGHAEQVFLRGFDAREGQDIEFTVGGVPINEAGNLHGNGYADTHFIIPELVESVRVLEGPFDPRQGNFAVAGSASYELGLEKRGLTAKYTYGSFDSHRMLLLWGPKSESTHTFAGAEIASTDGYGQNRDARRASAIGQYEGRLGEKGSWRVTGQAYSTSYHSAGVLREDDYQQGIKNFYDTYDPLQGGDSSRYSISGDIEAHSGDTLYRQQLFLIARGMRLRENFTGFLLDVQTPLQTPHGQRGDLLDLDVSELTIGARGSARFRAKALGQTQELELGYFARGDKVDSTQYRIEAATGRPYRLETDLESKLGDIGLFGDASLSATPWLHLRGGVRADLFTYDVLDKCAVHSIAHPVDSNPPGDASCLSQADFGLYREPVQRSSTASTAVMPRGSLLIGPIAHFTLSASYGRGVRSIDPVYITQDTATPFADVQAYEGGVSYTGGTSDVTVVARSIFFQTHVDRDLIFSETAGRNTLANGTTRTGWAGSLRLQGSFFDEAANLTLVRSTFDDTHLLVPYVPDLVFRSDTAFFHDLPLSIRGRPVRGVLGAGVTYVGKRPLPFGQTSDTIFTVDTQASLTWDIFELGVGATNLLGRRYRLGEYNYASDFHTEPQPTLVPMRHFTAGAPRAYFMSLAITLGGA